MKKLIKKHFASLIPLRYATVLLSNPRFLSDFASFRAKSKPGTDKPLFKDIFPFVNDRTANTEFDTHYIYHPAWAIRVVRSINPAKHVDIGSTLSFSAQLSAFIPTEFYDYRPAPIKLAGLYSGAGDLCNLHFENDSIESLSCMHTIEHIGLGRYGDPIDPEGDKRAAAELQRVLKPGGSLLFVTPVGRPRVQFNAHRIYSYESILSLFDHLTVKEFSLIPDDAFTNGMITNATAEDVRKQEYGCGCFWFTKK